MTAQVTLTARQAWEHLNERQQAYLLAIYDADQAAEVDIADRRRRWQKTPPASEWRWLLYAVDAAGLAGDTGVQAALRRQGKLDPGAGSSLAALRRRGLVQNRGGVQSTMLGTLPTVEVRLTTAGRAAARAGRGEEPKRRTPPGLLSEWLWRALGTLYRAGGTGTLYDHHGWHLPRDHPERGPSWAALLQLRDRRDGSYMEEFTTRVANPGFPDRPEHRARISARGRAHYELHYRCYSELYPEVDAVEPPATNDAHAGLADHRATRPKGLVRAPDWRLLAELTRMERDDRCFLRDIDARHYIQFDQPVPDSIASMPHGLVAWQIDRIARSKAAVTRLRQHPDGSLVEEVGVTVPEYRHDPEGSRTIPLTCLTPAGRAHVAAHLLEYQRLYPEIPVDDLTTETTARSQTPP
ncbi:MAG: hypothetical protein V7603_5181 [Micromonosporaceae bacterium]